MRRLQSVVGLALTFLVTIALHARTFDQDRAGLPTPTGPFAVGRATFHLVDARTDSQGSRPDGQREFMLVAWYPAERGAAAPIASWFPPEWAALEAHGNLGMVLGRSSDAAGKDIPGILRSVVVSAREGAPLARSGGRFPVLLFAPGNTMFPNAYSAVIEEMASQGYAVLAYVPTGFVTAVAFPDGRVTRRYANADFSFWLTDMKHILDQASEWNAGKGSLFFERLDLARVGVFGHSAGANAASEMSNADPRIKAGAALDAGAVRPEDAGIPFLLINAENAAFLGTHGNEPDVKASIERRRQFFLRSRPGIEVTLAGADHNSFTDMAVLPLFQQPGDGRTCIDTTRAFVREFFGEFLLGKRSELIRKGSAKYPIATVLTANWPPG